MPTGTVASSGRMPALGFVVMLDDAKRMRGEVREQVCIIFVVAMFLLRPNTAQGFRSGDVYIDVRRHIVIIFVRHCKRWPELRHSPAQREICCGAPGTPSGVVFDLFAAAAREDEEWYTRLARSASPTTGAAVLTAWVQARCDARRVPRPAGRHFTGYSVRIAVASTMWAYRMDERWIQAWGYWRTQDQYMAYVRKTFGRHPFLAGLVSFGFDLQDGRAFDFSTRRSAPPADARSEGLSARLQQLRPADRDDCSRRDRRGGLLLL